MALIYSKLKDGVTDVKIEIIYKGTHPVLAGYLYQLKTDDLNTPIEERQGDNVNSQDDIYPLPTPINHNKNRKVVLTSKISAIDHDAEYEVRMNVIQDGITTDTLKSQGKVFAHGEASLSFDMIKFT